MTLNTLARKLWGTGHTGHLKVTSECSMAMHGTLLWRCHALDRVSDSNMISWGLQRTTLCARGGDSEAGTCTWSIRHGDCDLHGKHLLHFATNPEEKSFPSFGGRKTRLWKSEAFQLLLLGLLCYLSSVSRRNTVCVEHLLDAFQCLSWHFQIWATEDLDRVRIGVVSKLPFERRLEWDFHFSNQWRICISEAWKIVCAASSYFWSVDDSHAFYREPHHRICIVTSASKAGGLRSDEKGRPWQM